MWGEVTVRESSLQPMMEVKPDETKAEPFVRSSPKRKRGASKRPLRVNDFE